jgi:hypothetical protein
MLRVAGSLVSNQVRGYDLLRMFAPRRASHPPGQAFIEYGRIAKPLHLLTLVDPIDGTPAADEPATHRAGIPPPLRPHDLPRATAARSARPTAKARLPRSDSSSTPSCLWNTHYLSAIERAVGVSSDAVPGCAAAGHHPDGDVPDNVQESRDVGQREVRANQGRG